MDHWWSGAFALVIVFPTSSSMGHTMSRWVPQKSNLILSLSHWDLFFGFYGVSPDSSVWYTRPSFHSQIPFCLSSSTPSALLKAYSWNVFLLGHHIFFRSFVASEMLLILLCWPCLTFTTLFLMTSMILSPVMLPKYELYWFRSGPLLLPPFSHPLPTNGWCFPQSSL